MCHVCLCHGALEIVEEEEAAQQQKREQREEQYKMSFDESPHRLAVAGEQGGLEEEAAAARDRRAKSENQGIEARDAAGDCDQLIGDGGEATRHHDQYSPAPVKAPELVSQRLQSIETNDRLSDGLEQVGAD